MTMTYLSNEDVELRTMAEEYLGDTIFDREFTEAKEYAAYKLADIISRFGDEDGARREPWYLAKLIEETVRSRRFSDYCNVHSQKIMRERQKAAATV